MICKKCNSVFNGRQFYNGQYRNFSKRKYCLTCSPFGLKNTKKLHIIEELVKSKKICSVCSREYTRSKKSNNNTLGFGVKDKCGSCYISDRRKYIKDKSISYKGGECVLCGYKKCNRSIVFHHLDPSEKEFNISIGTVVNWSRIQKELDKCVILCHNCHNEVHDGMKIFEVKYMNLFISVKYCVDNSTKVYTPWCIEVHNPPRFIIDYIKREEGIDSEYCKHINLIIHPTMSFDHTEGRTSIIGYDPTGFMIELKNNLGNNVRLPYYHPSEELFEDRLASNNFMAELEKIMRSC